MDNFVLIGMPGSGKSTVGVLLAKQLGYGFLDIDLILQQREGCLLQSLIANKGVERFLDLEAEAVASVSCRRTVIAPGGSCVLRARGIEHLQAQGRLLYLDVPLDVLTRRLHNIQTRGIAMQPGETLESIYAQRVPLYRAWADMTVPVAAGQSIEQTAAMALRLCGAATGNGPQG